MSDAGPNPLVHIQKGMAVYDADGNEIGEVDEVHLGQQTRANSDAMPGTESAIDEAIGVDGEHVITEGYPEILDAHQLPEALVERMLREGYLRVQHPGLPSADHVILPDQIDSVSEEGVYLLP